MSKVIFLDVDGVIVTWKTIRQCRELKLVDSGVMPPTFFLDPKKLMSIAGLCAVGAASVVISSTWRRSWRPDERGFSQREWLMGWLAWAGVPIHEDSFTTTATLVGSGEDGRQLRGDEIGEWLYRHPEVTGYVILDGDSDMLPDQMPFFVKCSMEHGLTAKLWEDAVDKLALSGPAGGPPEG